MPETREEKRAARIERREARRLRRTERRAVRLGRKLDPRIPEDLEEIEALAMEASMETQELIVAADYVGAGSGVGERLWILLRTVLSAVELDDDTIEAVADAINRAVDVPWVPEWVEGEVVELLIRTAWSAVDEALGGGSFGPPDNRRLRVGAAAGGAGARSSGSGGAVVVAGGAVQVGHQKGTSSPQ